MGAVTRMGSPDTAKSAMQYAINFVLLGGFAVLSIVLMTQSAKVYEGENPFNNKELHPTLRVLNFVVTTFIMVSVLVFALPALELAATALSRRSPVRTLSPGQLQPAPSSSLHRAQSPLELRSTWTLPDILVVVLCVLYNAFALLVPLWYYDVSSIYWETSIPPGAPPLTDAARWAYAVGAVAAWPCMGNMGLAMFPVSRCSPLLSILGASGYQQLLWVHKLAGRLAFVWLSVHGALCQFPVLAIDTYLYVYMNWDLSNDMGFWNGAGNLAWILLTLVVILSLRPIRRLNFEVFKYSHLLIWPMFLASMWHIRYFYMWVLLPIALYFTDVGLRWTLHAASATATATVVHIGGSSTVAGSKDPHGAMEQGADPQAGGAAPATASVASNKGQSAMVKLSIPIADLLAVNPGFDLEGEYIMVQVPQLGLLDWHPLSIAYVDATHVHLLVKTAGSWTQKLAALGLGGTNGTKTAPVSPAAVQVQVKVRIEGPYGNPITQDVLHQLSEGGEVLLAAGGVGVASMVRTLQAAAGGAGVKGGIDWSRLHLVWVVRSFEERALLGNLVQAVAAMGVQVTTYVTSGTTGSPAAGYLVPAVPSLPPVTRSSRSRWVKPVLLRGLVLWAATLGLMGGYMIGPYICGVSKYKPHGAEKTALEQQFNATVAANYKAATGRALAEGEWPEGQNVYSDAMQYKCWVGNNAPVVGMMADGPTGWPYAHPAPYNNVSVCWLCPMAANGGFSVLLGLVGALVAGWGAKKLSSCGTPPPSLPSAVSPGPHASPAVTCTDPHATPYANSRSGTPTPSTCSGRPNWATFLSGFLTKSKAPAAVEGAAHAPGGKLRPASAYVYVCGPGSMTAAIHRELAALVTAGKHAVSLHDINYAL